MSEQRQQSVILPAFNHKQNKYLIRCCCCCKVHCTTVAQIVGMLTFLATLTNITFFVYRQQVFHAVVHIIHVVATLSLLFGLCVRAADPVRIYAVWMKIMMICTIIGVFLCFALAVVPYESHYSTLYDNVRGRLAIVGSLLVIGVLLQYWIISVARKCHRYLIDYEQFCDQESVILACL